MIWGPSHKIHWNPLDDSPESLALGRVIWGDQLEKVMEELAKDRLMSSGSPSLEVVSVDHGSKTVTLRAMQEKAEGRPRMTTQRWIDKNWKGFFAR